MVLMVVAAYLPSLNGPLVFDDQMNITENPGVAINDLSFESLKTAFLSNNSGRLKRVLPALSFGVNHYMAGGFSNTFVFKATNLIVHLINLGLVFRLVLQLWPRFKFNAHPISLSEEKKFLTVYLAAVVALVWALHPIQVTTVVYIVQRMTSMAGTFVLLGLCVFVAGRQRFEQNQPGGLTRMWFGVIGGTLLGLMCKENAALLPLYAGVIEFTLFSRSWRFGSGLKKLFRFDSGLKRDDNEREKDLPLIRFYVVTLVLPVCFGLIYLFIYPGLLGGYASRPFTLSERLLTETRFLWFYLYMLFVPDITVMGLFHDDLSTSTGLLAPWTTLVSILAWILTILLAFLLRKQMPVFTFAVCWYLVGHSMESSFIPLKLIYEHRNYLPFIGPIILIVWTGWFLFSRFRLQTRKIGLILLCCGMIAGLSYATFKRAEYWRSENDFIESIAKNHPFSPSSQYLYGEVLYKKFKDPFAAYPYYFRAAQLEPDEAGFLVSVSMITPVEVVDELGPDQLSKLINPRHIAFLLETKPISAWGMRALDVSMHCVKNQVKVCKPHVHHLRNWLNAVASNNHIGTQGKRYFINGLFEIEMLYGLHKEALNTIIEAKEEDKGYIRYNLMHADALAALGRYQDSLKILDDTEMKKINSGDPYLKDLKRMRKDIHKIMSRIN